MLNFLTRALCVALWASLGFFLGGFALTLILFGLAKAAGLSDDLVAALPAVGTITGAILAGAAAWIGTRPETGRRS